MIARDVVWCVLLCCGSHNASSQPIVPSSAQRYFDVDAVSEQFDAIERDLPACAPPSGHGHVLITFATGGTVTSAIVDTAPFKGTPAAACIEQKLKTMRIAPYDGSPVKVGKTFSIP
jgi:hypothetical protein